MEHMLLSLMMRMTMSKEQNNRWEEKIIEEKRKGKGTRKQGNLRQPQNVTVKQQLCKYKVPCFFFFFFFCRAQNSRNS